MSFFMVYQNHASHGLNGTTVNAANIPDAIRKSGFNPEWVIGCYDLSHGEEIYNDMRIAHDTQDEED
jgi:hypothetical protein